MNSLKYLTSSRVRNLPIVKFVSNVVRKPVGVSGIVGPAPPRITQRFGRPCQNWIWGPSDVSPLPAAIEPVGVRIVRIDMIDVF